MSSDRLNRRLDVVEPLIVPPVHSGTLALIAAVFQAIHDASAH